VEVGESGEFIVSDNVAYLDGHKWDMSLMEQLTSLDGRINRQRYLYLFVGSFVIGIIYLAILGVFLSLLAFLVSGSSPESPGPVLVTIFLLPFYSVVYSLNVKRLQDTGRGGGWIRYAQVCLVLAVIYSMTPVDSEIESLMEAISAIVSFPLWIVCLFFKGEIGSNAFGPDPLSTSQ